MKIKQHLFLNMLFVCIAMLSISSYVAAATEAGYGYKNPGTHDPKAAFANNPEVDGACIPTINNPCVLYFTNITIGSINNDSGCDGGYSDFTGLSTDMTIGVSESISISVANYGHYVSVFIDLNDNGSLNDPGEQVLSNLHIPAWNTGTATITIPGNATPGNHLMRVIGEFEGSGYADNPCFHEHGEAEDYTVNISCGTTPIVYYADTDGDGYGDPAVSETTLCPLAGYVQDNTDCNDGDANYHINQDWYYDGDGDGYYGQVQSSCTPPAPSGWSLTTSGPDCNDTDVAINPVAAEIAGNDIDDNCNGGVDDCTPVFVNNCIVFFTNVSIGSINNTTSCSGAYDNYTAISTSVLAGSTVPVSFSVNNDVYVSVYIDFNKNGILNDPGEQVLNNFFVSYVASGSINMPAIITPGNYQMRVICTQYGYGPSNNPCGGTAYGEAEDYTMTISCPGDPVAYYADADGDLYGDPAVSETALCPSSGYILDNTDCNDSDANYHINQNWYYDSDGDGYYGQVQSSCTPPAPSGWSLTTTGPDCNDTDAAINPVAAEIAGNDIDDNCNGGVDDCTPVFVNNCIVAFSNVSIGSINNTTVCNGAYSNYTAMSTSALAGSTVPVSFSATNDVYISVYIDFNKNGILNDPGEQVLNNLFVHYGGSGSFNLPGIITPGNYQMRAICVLANGTSNNSCGGTEYGDAEDYTMTISCPVDPATYYADVDGDLYGDPAVSETALCPSPGYILDNTDCYDGDANYHINQDWYYDGDGDGYHGQVQNSCTPPGSIGWSLTTPGFDCDDTNATANPAGTDIPDNDIDDNCNGSVDDCIPLFYNNCIVIFTNVTIGSINNTTGCNGAYSNYTAMSTSAPAGSTVPVSFSINNHGYTSVYIDFNKNGILSDPGEQVLNNLFVPYYSDGTLNLPASITPGNYLMRVICTYSGNGPSNNPCGGTDYGEAEDYTLTISCPVDPVTYYADADGDGYGDPAVSETSLCPSSGYLLDNADCNDSDANYHINQNWYYDGDGDGYYGTVQSACTPPAPNGWSLITSGADCNDADPSIHPGATEVPENEVDDNCNGFTDECVPSLYSCTMYISNVTVGSINNTTSCTGGYSDYTNLSTQMTAGSTQTISFSTQNYGQLLSVYIDLNSNGILNDQGEQLVSNFFVAGSNTTTFTIPALIIPGNYLMRVISSWDNGGYSYNPCGGTGDGEAEDYTITIPCPDNPVTYYADADGDGYGDPATTESALCPSPGFVLDNSDCNDNDALLNILQNWYSDGDGDGYYGSVQSSCGAPDITGWSLTTSGPDCNDADANVNPLAVEISGNSIDENCNGVADDCMPVLYNPCVLYITNVTVGSINNNSGCQGGYSNFADQSTELVMGIPQAIAISGVHYGQYVSVFIDFNDNGVLNDAGEQVLHNLHVPAWTTSNGYLIIPGTATQGSHLMRVFSEHDGSGLANDPCFHHHGEAEDYTAIISCPSTPVTYYADADGDGYGDPGTSESALCPSPGYVYDNTDCNDADPANHVSANWYHDADGDGYNVGTVYSCGPPEPTGWTLYTSGTDCDDNNYYANPSVAEIQGNSIDDNCNGIVDEACIPAGGNCVLYISEVTIGTIDNVSSCSNGYENYEGMSTDMALGSTQTISVTGVNYPQYVSVFIDFNNNHILSDAGEQVVSNLWVDPFTTGTTTFTVPTSVPLGSHLMRVIGEYVGNGLANNPCYHEQSEAEDYTVNITCSETALDWFADSDGDSYGNPAISSSDVCPPVGYVNNDDDCDDSNAAAHPGAQDIVDSGVDENCNGITDDPCVPVIYNACVMYINNVTIGTINNSSSCSNYTDYTSLSTEMEMGGTQSVSISGSTYNQFVSVYIDFNENGIMNEAGERVVNNLLVPAESTGNTTFTLPLNANPGSYRMRVISTFESEGPSNNPCGQTNYGEAEDYTLIINCPATPINYYADSDGDGYGNPNNFETALCPSPGYILDNTDCNDSNANINLGVAEVVGNEVDDNCNGFIDECVPTFNNPCTVFFSNVTIGSINNTTGCNGAYSDYTNLSTEVFPGTTQTIAITNQSYDQFISVYLDINDNGNMQESGEMVVDNLMVLGGQTESATFNIPATMVPGSYTLRVISNFFGHGTNYNPCGYTVFGEAEDYTLTVVCPDLSTTYYADTDGDGYGDPNSTTAVADCAPEGYVLNNTDCDDTDTAVNPGATEILANMIDDDCDNEIDELPYCVPYIIEPCSQNSISIYHVTMGAIDNASTCNSTGYENFRSQSTSVPAGQDQTFTATIEFQYFTFGYFEIFVDFNRDGYFNGYGEHVNGVFVESDNNTFTGSFPIPITVAPGNYTVRITIDRNGYADPCYTVYGEVEDYTLTVTCPTTSVTYYADADGDGYGDPNNTNTVQDCAPEGYVIDNTDCNDTLPAYHSAQYWYLDIDGDGYYRQEVYSCGPPEEDGWSTQTYGSDCDDTNAAYFYETYWYFDGDGDGYFGNFEYTCIPQAGEGWSTQTYGTDCNDTNAALNYSEYWYFDGDGDGYSGDEVYTCIPPEGEGWSHYSNGIDCDDTNAAYFYHNYWYFDGDGDLYYGSYEYACIPQEGEGWSIFTYGEDCDDTNAALNYSEYWFFDGDGDGYHGNQLYTCIPQEGEGWSQYSNGPDCDDTNATYVYNNYWYYDGDGDGYFGQSTYACSPPEGEGWSDYGYSEDCDDNNPIYQLSNYFYLDADGDGYYAEFVYGCFAPEGDGWTDAYANGGGDCNDSDPTIHPGAEILGNGIDDNCDGVIDVLVYCTPDGYIDCDYYNYYINNVELGTMSNASGCSSSGYTDYTQLVVSADAGDEITYSVSTPEYSNLYIYIDYNLDGDFYDQDEQVVYDENYQYGVPFTGTIALPSGLADGSYRIRIKADLGYYYNEPCYYYYGEVEDYTINIGIGCADIDLDGYMDQACGGNDCDDSNSAINPAATEICNGDIDDNCNGTADDADNTVTGQGTYYADGDGDGYGGALILACIQPSGTITTGGDCYDASTDIYPGAPEACNGIDEDCDGVADNNPQSFFYPDMDGDGFGAGDPIQTCTQPANTSTNHLDCDDTNSAVSPVSQEICNSGLDDDCDGQADDADGSVSGQNIYYSDADTDGYGTGDMIVACIQPDNTSSTNDDCNDDNSSINPAATEICNSSVDDDCNIATEDPSYCNCYNALMSAIVAPSSTERMADMECIDGDWTHYFDEDGSNLYILLSIKKGGQSIGSIGDGTFAVRQKGSAGVTIIPNNYPVNYCNTLNWHVMNRYWEVEPTIQPTAGVNVRFYYTTNDFDALVSALANATPPRTLTSHEQMLFYKVEDLLGNAYDINPVNGHTDIPIASGYGADGYYEYQHGQEANTYTWHHEVFNSDYHYGEYTVSKFSGGGGGGGNVGGAFPIELLYFTGHPAATANILTWATATERNNQFQIIERSLNGTDEWMEIGRVTGAGNSVTQINYQLSDENPPVRAYYHLRAVDFNGAEQVSEVIYIERPSEVFSILNAFPVPVENDLHLWVNSPLSGEVTILLHDVLGSVVYKNETILSKGVNEITINMHDLPSGTYQVTLENKSSKVMKIVNRIKT